jgi:parallel beta-helix repeat protein
MRKLFVILFVLAAVPIGFGQLSGPLNGTLGPGIYHVVGTIQIHPGDSLRLLPGTTLIFDGTFPFIISGTLLVQGTDGMSGGIVFTTDTVANPGRWRGLRFAGSSSSGSWLAYCLIERGYAIGIQSDNYGGGVYCNGSSPTFTHCTIQGNDANDEGGGVYLTNNSSPAFTNCAFIGNTAGYGGGVQCGSSSPSFTNCTMGANLAGWGGGVYCNNSSLASFTNCTISGNTARERGGGVYCQAYSSPTFTSCTMSGNSTGGTGGGAYCYVSSPIFNSTIIAFSIGSGILFSNSAGSGAYYCDIFGNSGGSFSYVNNDPSQGPPGLGQLATINANGDSADIYMNIFLDPTFADTAAGDFHLTDYSPCIGAAYIEGWWPQDFEGDPRPNPYGSWPDIGMDESWLAGPVRHLVIMIENGNAVLSWPHFAYWYRIYGAETPTSQGTYLDYTEGDTIWTDINTSTRHSPYFYYVRAWEEEP